MNLYPAVGMPSTTALLRGSHGAHVMTVAVAEKAGVPPGTYHSHRQPTGVAFRWSRGSLMTVVVTRYGLAGAAVGGLALGGCVGVVVATASATPHPPPETIRGPSPRLTSTTAEVASLPPRWVMLFISARQSKGPPRRPMRRPPTRSRSQTSASISTSQPPPTRYNGHEPVGYGLCSAGVLGASNGCLLHGAAICEDGGPARLARPSWRREQRCGCRAREWGVLH